MTPGSSVPASSPRAWAARCACRGVAAFLDSAVALPAVGDDRRAWFDVVHHEPGSDAADASREARSGSGPSLWARGPRLRRRSDLLARCPAAPQARLLAADVRRSTSPSRPAGAPRRSAPRAADGRPRVWKPISSVRFRKRRNPILPRGNSQQAVNHTVNGVRVRSKMVPAVTEVRLPHPAHITRPSPRRHSPRCSQAGHEKPVGHRATPGSPDSPHRYRTKPGTRPPILGSACRPSRFAIAPSRTPTPVK